MTEPVLPTHPHPPTASMTSRHGVGGGGDFPLFSLSTFSVARVILAVHVFLCHAFYPVHHWFGFLSVAGFFFISGYGMSMPGRREKALLRLPRFLAVLGLFSLIYYFMYGVWFYPTSWFLVSYSVAMLLYRFLGFSRYLFIFHYLVYLLFLHFIEVDYVWVMSPFAFLLGMFYYNRPDLFRLKNVFLLFVFSAPFFCFTYELCFTWFWMPLYCWIVFKVSSIPYLSFLKNFAFLTFPFFSLHCWVLGVFNSTWTLGGSSHYFYAFVSFIGSVCGAYLLWFFIPLFRKKKRVSV